MREEEAVCDRPDRGIPGRGKNVGKRRQVRMWIVPLSFSGLQSRRSQVVEGECGSKDQPAFEMGNAGGFRLIWEHQGTFVEWLRSPGLGASWEHPGSREMI